MRQILPIFAFLVVMLLLAARMDLAASDLQDSISYLSLSSDTGKDKALEKLKQETQRLENELEHKRSHFIRDTHAKRCVKLSCR
jgi:hypothetical protein